MFSTLISNLLVLRPGLFPVVQTSSVAEADLIGHGISSMIIEFSVITLENPVPEKVTSVPPVTVPYLGDIELSNGVNYPL